jgi:hypothetical protein
MLISARVEVSSNVRHHKKILIASTVEQNRESHSVGLALLTSAYTSNLL